MRILGVETSCDETAVAVIDVTAARGRLQLRVLSNVVASQVKLHAKFGGVVPHLAKREHQKNLVPVLLAALRESRIQKLESRRRTMQPTILDSRFQILDSILEREPDLFARMVPKVLSLKLPKIDAIAVTMGPGLAPALWVGVNFARALAYLWRKPLIPVNHLEGHIYTNLLEQVRVKSKIQIPNSKTPPNTYPLTAIRFPALCLIVSGGHTELVLMSGYGKYRVIGETLDDAAGEAFDKVAKMLGLGFPGGPIISKLAERGNPHALNFPRPMLHSKDFNFSFSGLKTAVLYYTHDREYNTTHRRIHYVRGRDWKTDVAASFEQAVTDVLVAKTVRAARHYRVRTVMIGGGVAANKKLRGSLGAALARSLPGTRYLVPDLRFTGDNALMIALAGWFNLQKKTAWRALQADANLRLDHPSTTPLRPAVSASL